MMKLFTTLLLAFAVSFSATASASDTTAHEALLQIASEGDVHMLETYLDESFLEEVIHPMEEDQEGGLRGGRGLKQCREFMGGCDTQKDCCKCLGCDHLFRGVGPKVCKLNPFKC